MAFADSGSSRGSARSRWISQSNRRADPITYETVKSYGLPARSDIPADLLDLLSLYPQPVRRQPSVEYLPERRRFEGRGGAQD